MITAEVMVMARVIDAVYTGGVFRPVTEVSLAEGDVVSVQVPEQMPLEHLAALMAFAGYVHGGDPEAGLEASIAVSARLRGLGCPRGWKVDAARYRRAAGVL